jgi:hypothetical protein
VYRLVQNMEVLGPAFTWSRYLAHKQFQLVGITFVCRLVRGEVQLSAEHSDFQWVPLATFPVSDWKESELVVASIRRYQPPGGAPART